jgi:hypothetical protein
MAKAVKPMKSVVRTEIMFTPLRRTSPAALTRAQAEILRFCQGSDCNKSSIPSECPTRRDVNSGVARFSFDIPAGTDRVFAYGQIISNLSQPEPDRDVCVGRDS